MKNNSIQKEIKSKKKGYVSLLLLLLTLSLFVTSTYALFTDTAYSHGNKVFSGNMYVDIVATQKQMIDKYNAEHPNGTPLKYNDPQNTIDAAFETAGYDFKKYAKHLNGEKFEYYYIITNKDAKTVNLFNIEPGSTHILPVYYLNTGNLAFKTVGLIQIDVDEDNNRKSYTGLETLNRQFKKQTLLSKNNYVVSTMNKETGQPTDPYIDQYNFNMFNDNSDARYYSYTNGFVYNNYDEASNALKDYNIRYENLFEKQSVEVDDESGDIVQLSVSEVESPAADADNYVLNDNLNKSYKDVGGNLENILEVYIIPSVENFSSNKFLTDENQKDFLLNNTDFILDKSNNYYFGNLDQFDYLMKYGGNANKDFDYSSYVLDDSENTELITLEEIEAKSEADRKIEEQYMVKYNSISANLYEDYKRYLDLASGYCLPADSINNNDTSVDDSNIQLHIYGENGSTKTIDDVSEVGNTMILLHMPLDATSKYENASISLSLGVTATQVEFEMDDTGYMIYDQEAERADSNVVYNKGDLLYINLSKDSADNTSTKGNVKTMLFRILDINDDIATCATSVSQRSYKYFEGSIPESSYDGDFIKYKNSKIYDELEQGYSELKTLLNFDDGLLLKQDYYQKQYKLTVEDSLDTSLFSRLRGLLSSTNEYSINTGDKIIKLEQTEKLVEPVSTYVRPLELSDIFNCLGNKNITNNQLRDFVFGFDQVLYALSTDVSQLNNLTDAKLKAFLSQSKFDVYFGDTFVVTDDSKDIKDLPALSYFNLSGDLNYSNNTSDYPGVESACTIVVKMDLSKLNKQKIAFVSRWENQDSIIPHIDFMDFALVKNKADLSSSNYLEGVLNDCLCSNSTIKNIASLDTVTKDVSNNNNFINDLFVNFDNPKYNVFYYTFINDYNENFIQEILLNENGIKKLKDESFFFIGAAPTQEQQEKIQNEYKNKKVNFIGIYGNTYNNLIDNFTKHLNSDLAPGLKEKESIKLYSFIPSFVKSDYEKQRESIQTTLKNINGSATFNEQYYDYYSEKKVEEILKVISDLPEETRPNLVISFDPELSSAINASYNIDVITISPMLTTDSSLLNSGLDTVVRLNEASFKQSFLDFINGYIEKPQGTYFNFNADIKFVRFYADQK